MPTWLRTRWGQRGAAAQPVTHHQTVPALQALFLEAVERLPRDVTAAPRFEALLVGGRSIDDEELSTAWLEERVSKWTWKHRIMRDMPRSQALDAMKNQGMLLVLPSLVKVLTACPVCVAWAVPALDGVWRGGCAA